MLEIYAVGGYNEIGKNMTAIKVDDEMIVLDMGLFLDAYIKYTEGDDLVDVSPKALRAVGAVPDDSLIKPYRSIVKAIIPTHAHLDHCGAIPFMAKGYEDAEIICTPYTAEIIKAITKDENIKMKNKIKVLHSNSHLKISDNISIEFINVTHSTPQTVMVAVHTKYGVVLYANDFKFDNSPVLGKKPNYERLEEIGKKGLLALIVDSTRAGKEGKTSSESVAKEMLRDVMLGTNSKGRAVLVTTFSSHLARLKSIVEFGREMNRKILFLGRSLSKYTRAGENIGLIRFSNEIELAGFKKKIKKRLAEVEKAGRDKYLLVVTGHQGEPKSTLSRIANNEFPFRLHSEDHVIFSCAVIPSEVNINNRKKIEEKLKAKGARIFKDIHASGHASREDLIDLIDLVNPDHIIPAHCERHMADSMAEIALEKGYKKGQTLHLIRNGNKLVL